jgi:hypothetical protein
LATSHLNILPETFWGLTPYEWSLIISGFHIRREFQQSIIGSTTWFTGVASQSDLNKISYRRWMESFQDAEKVKAAKEAELAKGAELWKQAERVNKKK